MTTALLHVARRLSLNYDEILLKMSYNLQFKLKYTIHFAGVKQVKGVFFRHVIVMRRNKTHTM